MYIYKSIQHILKIDPHPSPQYESVSWTLKDTCFPDTTPKISNKIHFKHDYVFLINFGSILKKYTSF